MELPLPPADYEKRMRRCVEESHLCVVGQDAFGRDVWLADDAAAAWFKVREAAEEDGVRLLLLSGFRSVSRQAEIVQKKLAAGESLETILRVSAYPGFSEHHSGRAIDFGSPECEHFSEAFESTREFSWLCEHAARHEFRLSYPRSNTSGIIYEPWHWRLTKAGPIQPPCAKPDSVRLEGLRPPAARLM
ncbi:MAG TPA: M15 family metallopeptidase [Opitutaceae bacterium]|nr:M15 family metallopeptidase [Opitutaceae bacterium]